VQVTVALTGMLRIRTPARPEWRSCQAVLIPPDVTHEIDARGALVLIAFFDPESDLAIPFLNVIGSAVTPVRDHVVDRWREMLGRGETLDSQGVDRWIIRELSNGRRERRVHPGVQRVLEHLRRDHLERRETSLTTLARVAGLSRSRLMHVFTESVGIPLRPYLLWLRVQRAACALNSGYSVTEAAHLAGFSDAPHLARSLRRTLGATPRQVLRRVPEMKDP
jgi:AraC-like DNA-binding protein